MQELKINLSDEEQAAVRAAAELRQQSAEEFVRDAVLSFTAPATTHAAEAAALGEHIIQPALERLSFPARISVLFVGWFMRWFWIAVGRGRYRIGGRLLANRNLRLRGPGKISIGKSVNAWARSGSNIIETFRPEATVNIGNRVRLNGCGIQAASKIEIGDDVILGSCTIVDTDHHPVSPENRKSGAVRTKPIIIGRNAWIGGAAVLKGVSVGENSVVGLGSVVTEDVPANVVVAGNPARVVRRLDD